MGHKVAKVTDDENEPRGTRSDITNVAKTCFDVFHNKVNLDLLKGKKIAQKY